MPVDIALNLALFPNVSTKVAALSQALSVAGLLTALLIANCSASLWYTVAGLLICSISLHSGMNIWSLKLDLPPMSRVAKRPINVRIPNNNSHNSRSFSNASSPANSVSPALAGTPVRGLMSPASNTGSNGNLLKFSIPKGSGKGVVSGVSAVAAVPAGVAPTASLPMSASKNGAFDFETEMQEFKSLIANAAHDLKTVRHLLSKSDSITFLLCFFVFLSAIERLYERYRNVLASRYRHGGALSTVCIVSATGRAVRMLHCAQRRPRCAYFHSA